jgi:hypothetical protein
VSTLAKLFRGACSAPSDLKEHCGTLYELARQCRQITVLGTRTGTAATVFLYARPARLVCYDSVKCPAVERLQALAGGTEFVFQQADVFQVEIEETDLLFVDTLNEHEQRQEELRNHVRKVRKYLVLRGTTIVVEESERKGNKGIGTALEELLAQGSFRLKERYHHNNNGLSILERIS